MAYNYEYPYTDPYRYNDDWILNRVKELSLEWIETRKEWNNTREEFASLKAFIQNYFAQLDVQDEVNVKLDIMARDGSLSALISPLFSEYKKEIDRTMSEQNGNISILSARMDAFTALSEGSTTGDAELADGRVDFTGKVWPNIGDSIRGVTGNLSNDIASIFNKLDTNLIPSYSYVDGYYLHPDTGEVVGAADWTYNEEYIRIEPSTEYSCGLVAPGSLVIVFYDASKQFISTLVGDNYRYIFTSPANAVYLRYAVFNTNVMKSCRIVKGRDFTHPLSIYETTIFDVSSKAILGNANDAPANSIFLLQISEPNVVENLPENYPTNAEFHYLVTTENYAYTDNGGSPHRETHQYILQNDFLKVYHRFKFEDEEYSEWLKIVDRTSIERTIYVGAGQEFTSIKSAVEYATQYPNSTVYILDGTYDIVSEYGGELSGYGIYVGHGIKMYFSPKAYITCHYTGDDENIMQNFSPFNSWDGDFEIVGLNLSASNVRYCFHDELSGMDGFFTHKFINCSMKLDNSQSPFYGGFNQCIGGGLGKGNRIIIEGGSYESIGVNPNLGTISYHNAEVADAQSEIFIKDVYFVGDGDSCRFGWYGASTLSTKCYVTNCSCGVAPVIRQENADYNNINMELISWGNTIRNQS